MVNVLDTKTKSLSDEVERGFAQTQIRYEVEATYGMSKVKERVTKESEEKKMKLLPLSRRSKNAMKQNNDNLLKE